MIFDERDHRSDLDGRPDPAGTRCAPRGALLSRRGFVLTSLGSALLATAPWGQSLAAITSAQDAGDRASTGKLKLQISIGHRAKQAHPFLVRFQTSTEVHLDSPENPAQSTWRGTAGKGHVETRDLLLSYPSTSVSTIQQLELFWQYLVAHSNADVIRRLADDPAWRIDPRTLTVECESERASGFTVTVDQLTRNRSIWVPSLDLYIATGESPVPLDEYLRSGASSGQTRILQKAEREPDATYEQFTDLWQDMGNPAYIYPRQLGPGHIICLAWDSSIAKFGVDRGAGVWNDLGNPNRFRFWFGFGNLADGIVPYWKSQHLKDGLPIVTTIFERDGARYEVEQFSYPLDGPPQTRDGEIKMLLLGKITVTNLTSKARQLDVTMMHQRSFPPDTDTTIISESREGRIQFLDTAHHKTILAIRAPRSSTIAWAGVKDTSAKMSGVQVIVSLDLPASGSQELFVTLPSQTIRPGDQQKLDSIEYDTARRQTIGFWSDYVGRGAQFTVPEKIVNDHFRASLWHALRLPRRHADGTMDLPFSNFGYSQKGTPWPINQAVYVDYMLYGLRGYQSIAAEELAAIYHNNQEFNGHLNGNAEWLTYTPGMVYAAALNFLLSGDRKAFEKVLPDTLKALDFSLEQVRRAGSPAEKDDNDLKQTIGLVKGPLNDNSGSGYWAFNQAYLYAAIDAMGAALGRIGHPRAAECTDTAERFRSAVQQAFRYASVASPLVQLRDRSWTPFVPSQATHTGRNYLEWYPSDVDTGPTHLIRLKVIDPQDPLSDAMLNDVEDNLFLHDWGMASEPVYNQQATAYLLRDDVKAAIRSFYSYLACGFSQSALEPVEHRWCIYQVFGPPSTDGAWFELFRNMLVREVDKDTLLLGQATPRRWLQPGKKINVKDAPTWFGTISFEMHGDQQANGIHVALQLERREPLKLLLVRIRHPEGKKLKAVTVNGSSWKEFDSEKEWVRIANPTSSTYKIAASY